MSSDILKDYPILANYKNNTFFDNEFLKRIQSVINSTKNNIVKTNKIKNNGIKIHKERIVNDYIIPLSYLIYSFIYTKYYNYQVKNQMMSENRLYYSMFGYVFKHNNPVIKKVNVNLYNYFKNEDLSSTSEITLDIIITQKEPIIIFLDSTVIPKMKEDNDYKLFEKYNIILDYFNKITLDVINIIKNLKLIIEKIKPETSNTALTYFNTLELGDLNSLNTDLLSISNINEIHNLYKKINDFYKTKIVDLADKSSKVNFISIFNDISIEKQSNKFNQYEENYYKLLDIYKNMIKKIEFINTQIIELDNKDNLIYYDNINLFIIASSYQKYYDEYIKKEKIKNDINSKIVNIKNIKLYIEQKIDTYKELFYNNKNNSNTNKKIKTDLYLEKIDEINEKINKNLESLLDKKKNNAVNSAKNSKTSNISEASKINSKNNVNFNDFLKYFILSFQVNEQIEKNYIKVIYKNSKNSKNSNINIKEYLSKLQSYKIIFNNLFKDYKKLDKNSEAKNLEKKEKENILKLESIKIRIKSSEKNINSSTIDSNISQLESKIITTNDQLKTATKDLEEIEIEKTKIENIKNSIDIQKLITNNNKKKILADKDLKEKELDKKRENINSLEKNKGKEEKEKNDKEDKLNKINSINKKKNNKIAKLKSELDEENKKLVSINNELKTFYNDLISFKTAKNSLLKEQDRLKKESEKNKEELKNLNKRLEENDKDMKSLKEKIKKINIEIKNKNDEIDDLNIELSKSTITNDEKDKINKTIKIITRKLEQDNKQLVEYNEDKNNLEKNIEEINKKIDELNKKTYKIENIEKLKNIESELLKKEQKKSSFESEKGKKKREIEDNIEKLNKELKRLEDRNSEELKKINTEIIREKTEIQTQIKEIETRINNIEEKIKKLTQDINSLQKELDNLNSILEIIELNKDKFKLDNSTINKIDFIYNNIKKDRKIDVSTLINYSEYEEIEKSYLDKNPSNRTDFTSKNIYRRIFIILNYYNRDYNNKTKDIKRLENELTNLKNNKNSKKIKKYIFDMYNEIKENLESISSIIKEEKLKISTNSKNNSNKDLKDKFNNQFNSIIIISKKYQIVIDSKNYKKMNNKLLNYYNKNYNFIKIIDKITNNKIRNNEIRNNESIEDSTKESKKENKISTENANKKITDELSDYFSSNDIFIDKLNPIFSNKFNDENVVLFFDQYQEFYNILKNKKIQLLLNKINTGMIKYNNSPNNFTNGIQTKIEYYNKIIKLAEPSKNIFKDKKGKYTQVLPYTDIMFLYFIDLLIIIDYLTFYYD